MKFIPKSEDELARDLLLEPGEYPFEVLSARDRVSQSGNEMIELKLNVFGDDGQQSHVYDYLLEKMAFKLRHFAETTGLIAKYEAGNFEAMDCLDKQGVVRLAIDPGSNGYSPKNVVKDYIKPAPSAESASSPTRNTGDKAPASAPAASKPLDDFDTDIPF